MTQQKTETNLTKVQKKQIHSWCMYDWANSAFATSLMVAILPPYIIAIFKSTVGESTTFLGLNMTGSTLWSFAVAFSTAIVALSSPILGVISDQRHLKKRLLTIYTIGGSFFTILAFFSAYTSNPLVFLIGCFIIATIGFGGATVWYNSLLPNLAEPEYHDQISCRGFAYGYLGGGLLLVVHLIIIMIYQNTPEYDLIVRLCIASVGFWWFGFGLYSILKLPEPKSTNTETINILNATKTAFSQIIKTLRNLRTFKMLGIFLISYLLFNDGIQTVITISGAFGPEVLGITITTLMYSIIIIQFVAAAGSIMFEKLAKKLGANTALQICLVGWIMIIVLAIGFAPLKPGSHENFDYQLEYNPTTNIYVFTKTPELSDSKLDKSWGQLKGDFTKYENISIGTHYSANATKNFIQEANLQSRFSISINEGPLKTTIISNYHPANISGPLKWWPNTIRSYLWKPLGINISMQWLILGIFVGIFMGGSQALARSIFSVMTPKKHSGEFFGFFGLVGRASAVFGPLIYGAMAGLMDQRIGILAILILIIAGTLLLRKVDIEAGKKTAIAKN